MSVHELKREIKRIPREEVDRLKDEASMRSLEISQMRILARKWPHEFKSIADQIVVDKNVLMTA